jgi:branched-subunit amino acid permease
MPIKKVIPFSENHFGWVLPAVIVFILMNVFRKFTTKVSE